MTAGAKPCLRSSFLISRKAAFVLRRRCMRMSRTSPSLSTARQPEPFAPDPDHHLVEVPGRARPRSQAPQLAGEERPELEHPAPDRLIGHVQPALGQEVFDAAEAEGEPEIEPDRVPDDLGRETMTMERRAAHTTSLPRQLHVTTPQVPVPLNLSRLSDLFRLPFRLCGGQDLTSLRRSSRVLKR